MQLTNKKINLIISIYLALNFTIMLLILTASYFAKNELKELDSRILLNVLPLSTIFIAPIYEELIFRGFLINKQKSFLKIFLLLNIIILLVKEFFPNFERYTPINFYESISTFFNLSVQDSILGFFITLQTPFISLIFTFIVFLIPNIKNYLDLFFCKIPQVYNFVFVSLSFVFIHSEQIQQQPLSIITFVFGSIILGLIALKWGLIYSILFHILNNTFISLLSYIIEIAKNNQFDIMILSILVFTFTISITILIIKLIKNINYYYFKNLIK